MKLSSSLFFALRGLPFFLLVVVLFSSFVTSSSIIGSIPDICLPYDTHYYDIWLEDYYSIDLDANILVCYDSPTNGNRLCLEPGFGSLNLESFEIAYYFSGGKDLVRMETYDTNENFTIYVGFEDPGLNQSFDVEVRADCTENGDPNPDNYFNFSGLFFSYLVSYFPFDDSLSDFQNDFDASGSATYSSVSLYNKSLEINNAYINLTTSTSSFSGHDRSYSFWFLGNDTGGVYELFYCDDLEGSVDFQTLFVVSDDLTIAFQGSGDYTNTTNLSDGSWHHFVIIEDNTNWDFYVDDSLVFQKDGSSVGFNCYLGDESTPESLFVDDFLFFNFSLNSSDVSSLYSSGVGYNLSVIPAPNLPSSSTIPDAYLNGSQSIFYDLAQYFGNWTDIYLKVNDPWNDYTYKIYTGFSTLNTDFYEIGVFANGTLNITSYERTYDFPVYAFACNYTPYEECTNQTFHVYIDSEIGNVSQINPLLAYYDIGYSGSHTFSGNYFFEYYDDIVFSFPDTNFTGNVGSGFNYTLIEDPEGDFLYMVFMSCDVSQSSSTTEFFGDLNVTLRCGSQQSYYDVHANNDYQQTVYFTASNSKGSVSDYTIILAGDYDLPSGYIPSEVESSTSGLTSYFFVFGNLLPSDLSSSSKSVFSFSVLSIIFVVVFLFSRKVSVSFAFYLSYFITLMFSFLFATYDYLTFVYPILFLFLILLFFTIKFFRGSF